MILKREAGQIHDGVPRLGDYASFRDFAFARADELARRIAETPGFAFEPESRARYAAQLGLPDDDDALRDLWESYHDGDGAEYEKLQLGNGAEIFVCIYRYYVTVLVSLEGRDTCWGERPGRGSPWGSSALYVESTEDERRLLLENRRLARLMLTDIEVIDSYLFDCSLTTYNLDVWAPTALRGLAVDAAVSLSGGGTSTALSKLNAKMRVQVEQETAIYRWYDADERPIYYGIAGDLAARQDQHARASSWAVFAARCEVTWAPTRRRALIEERRLILRDLPVFNRQHNDTPEARDRYMLYLAERGRLDLAQ